MTGAGAPGGPGIIQALQNGCEMPLYIADADPMAAGKALLPGQFYQIPPASDPTFCDVLLKLCLQLNVGVILPLVTRELFLFSENKRVFGDAGIRIVVSPFEALAVANDKARLLQHLKNCEIAVPDFRVAETWEEIENAAIELGFPEKVVCIKPAVSNGSRGFREIRRVQNAFEKFFNEKPGNVSISLQELSLILKGNVLPRMVVMEYLPGDEFTVDCLVVNGQARLILPRLRIAMNNGISVKGRFEKQPEIQDYCGRILSSLPFDGPVGIQVKQDVDGNYRILEINPRLQGSSTSAMGMGINLPVLAIHNALGNEAGLNWPSPEWGLEFARIYKDIWFR